MVDSDQLVLPVGRRGLLQMIAETIDFRCAGPDPVVLDTSPLLLVIELALLINVHR
jgi:hypothetical protein